MSYLPLKPLTSNFWTLLPGDDLPGKFVRADWELVSIRESSPGNRPLPKKILVFCILWVLLKYMTREIHSFSDNYSVFPSFKGEIRSIHHTWFTYSYHFILLTDKFSSWTSSLPKNCDICESQSTTLWSQRYTFTSFQSARYYQTSYIRNSNRIIGSRITIIVTNN